MSSYLLLRDNKEKGPYTLEELRNLGLKAYDLVWVQGKSAAWRYPSEIEELKNLSAALEEQPFDRFYKKKNDDKKQEVEVAKKENSTSAGPVFVSLPGEKIKNIVQEPVTTSSFSKTISITENQRLAEVKYAKPLDEIKEMYVKTLMQRKQKIARKNFISNSLKRASVFFLFIAVGVLIGFTMRSKSSKKQQAINKQIDNTQSAITAQVQPSNQSPEELAQIKSQSDDLPKSQNGHIQKTELHKKILFPKKKKEVSSNQTENASSQSFPGIETNPVTGERTKKSRTQNDFQNPAIKEDINKLVFVKSNDYKRGAFGGIRDLQLTVTNDSKYILDTVIVELQYLKPSEQPLKSENIQFRSVSPNGSMTITIPPSNRGIKVAYKITRIKSKEFNDETAGM